MGHLKHFIKREASSIIYASGNTHFMFLFPCINISTSVPRPVSFSLPPPGGHFVSINHTVTLRSPKMASATTYSWLFFLPANLRVPCLPRCPFRDLDEHLDIFITIMKCYFFSCPCTSVQSIGCEEHTFCHFTKKLLKETFISAGFRDL